MPPRWFIRNTSTEPIDRLATAVRRVPNVRRSRHRNARSRSRIRRSRCRNGRSRSSEIRSPSAEDREKMDCVANPFGPNDAPRPRCMELLKQDNDAVKPRLGACSLMQCARDAFAVADTAGTCGCVPRAAVESRMPGHRACQALTCAEGSACVCHGAACSCQVLQATLPTPWIVPAVGPPGPRPPTPRAPLPMTPDRPNTPRQ